MPQLLIAVERAAARVVGVIMLDPKQPVDFWIWFAIITLIATMIGYVTFAPSPTRSSPSEISAP